MSKIRIPGNIVKRRKEQLGNTNKGYQPDHRDDYISKFKFGTDAFSSVTIGDRNTVTKEKSIVSPGIVMSYALRTPTSFTLPPHTNACVNTGVNIVASDGYLSVRDFDAINIALRGQGLGKNFSVVEETLPRSYQEDVLVTISNKTNSDITFEAGDTIAELAMHNIPLIVKTTDKVIVRSAKLYPELPVPVCFKSNIPITTPSFLTKVRPVPTTQEDRNELDPVLYKLVTKRSRVTRVMYKVVQVIIIIAFVTLGFFLGEYCIQL